jgi:hypothetical protein
VCRERVEATSEQFGHFINPLPSHTRKQALAQGIPVVGPAGDLQLSKLFGFNQGLATPANEPDVIGVGAVDRYLFVAPFTNGARGGMKPEVSALGVAAGPTADQDGTAHAASYVAAGLVGGGCDPVLPA